MQLVLKNHTLDISMKS